MSGSPAFWRKLKLPVLALLAWTVIHMASFAQAGEDTGGGGAAPYVFSYFLVILCIGLALLALCRSSRRRERPKGEQYEAKAIGDLVAEKRQVPVIMVGMRMDQVTKLLGKPIVARRGADIYRELAMAGRLSEEEAAKEHLIYDHPVGRYELVVLDKQVVEVKMQPASQQAQPS
jgi:hypothetical protein